MDSVAKPEEWVYSNYLEWLARRSGTLVDRAFIQAHFGNVQRYHAYVASYLSGEVILPNTLGDYLAKMERV